MRTHDLTVTACTRLQHWWERHGQAIDPAPAICRIASEVAPTSPQVREHLEADLQDAWARLCAQEGDEQ